MNTAVYFDLETGGVQPEHPDIQLAAIAIDEATGREIEQYEAKIAFDLSQATPEALEINHYTAEAWANAKPPAVVVAGFGRFLDRFKSLQMVSKRTGKPYRVAKLVGHNAASFDGPRLQRLFAAHNAFLPADPRVRCTLQRAMWWFDETGSKAPQDFKLATLCEYFEVPVSDSHEALADVRLCIRLAQALRTASMKAA